MQYTVQHILPPVRRNRLPDQEALLRLILIILTTLAGCVLSWNSRSEEQEIAARVNGEPITRAQFDRMAANPLILLQARQEGSEKPDPKEVERLALRKLIRLRLMVQEADRRQITIAQAELDEAVAALRRRFDALADFGKWVQEQGLNDPELFEAVRTDMSASRVAAALTEDVKVTKEQVKKYFETHQGDLIIGTEVRLRIIAVPEKSKAEEILTELRQGKSFARLAYERSHGKLASQGGDTTWVDFRTLPVLLQEAVGKLQPGDVAGPLEKAKDEYLLIGLQARRPLQAKNLEEAYSEIERRFLAEKRQEFLNTWLEEQEKKADIEVFLNSET